MFFKFFIGFLTLLKHEIETYKISTELLIYFFHTRNVIWNLQSTTFC